MGQYLFVLPSRIVSSVCGQISIARNEFGVPRPEVPDKCALSRAQFVGGGGLKQLNGFLRLKGVMATIPRITGK